MIAPNTEAEAARLKAEGWDTVIRPVDAFSTLGITRDPLYSFMKSYPPFDLAATMIHEQTHATLFVRSQPQFNEELATFVGDEGALRWLEETTGQDSLEYRDAVDGQEDAKALLLALRDLTAALGAVYGGELPRDGKLARKSALIGEFRGEFDARVRPRFPRVATAEWTCRSSTMPSVVRAVRGRCAPHPGVLREAVRRRPSRPDRQVPYPRPRGGREGADAPRPGPSLSPPTARHPRPLPGPR